MSGSGIPGRRIPSQPTIGGAGARPRSALRAPTPCYGAGAPAQDAGGSMGPNPGSRLRVPSGIPARSGLPMMTPSPRSPSISLLRPPGSAFISGMGSAGVSHIPPRTQFLTPGGTFTTPVGASGVPLLREQRPRPKSCNPNLGAIPKTSSKNISVRRQTKSGPQIMTSTSSRKIIEADQAQAAEPPRYFKPKMAGRMPRPAPPTRKLQVPPKRKQDVRSSAANTDDVEVEGEYDQARATTSTLEQELECTLLEAASRRPKTPLIGTTSRKSAVSPPMMMTDYGPIPVEMQVISTKSFTKQAGQPDLIGRDLTTIETMSPCQAERTEVIMSRVTPHQPGRPSPNNKEMVIVQSTVSIGGGYKQTVKTVTYEGDPEDMRQSSVIPSAKEVAKLVREETAMINETLGMHMPDVMRISPTTYPIRKQALGYSLDQEEVAQLEDHVLCDTCIPIPMEPEEPTPEMIAEMMNNEERGLTMADTPTNVYNYLFADDGHERKIEVTSAAAYPLQDVVVPGNIPDMSMDIANVDEVMNVQIQASSFIAGTSSSQQNENSYCVVVGEEPLQSKNAARKGGKTKRKRVTPLAQEVPPWGAIQDVEPVIDVVGGGLAANRSVRGEAEEEIDPMVEGIEFLLQMEQPQHYSRIQLRGSQKPSWFPGYLMALPDLPNLISVAKSPSEVFAAAWRATQPDIFEDDSVFII